MLEVAVVELSGYTRVSLLLAARRHISPSAFSIYLFYGLMPFISSYGDEGVILLYGKVSRDLILLHGCIAACGTEGLF